MMAFSMRVGIVTLKMWRVDMGIITFTGMDYLEWSLTFALSFFSFNIARSLFTAHILYNFSGTLHRNVFLFSATMFETQKQYMT